MSTVAERIAALNAKKKVEEPPAPAQRKSIKWQAKPLDTKPEPASGVASPPRVVSPQGGKPTPSWLKGSAPATATVPREIPVTKVTAQAISPQPSPAVTPNLEQNGAPKAAEPVKEAPVVVMPAPVEKSPESTKAPEPEVVHKALPPAPVKEPEPEPIKVAAPEPAKVVEPEPIKVVVPEPVAEPEPPAPVMKAVVEAEPAKSSEPEALQDVESPPEPIVEKVPEPIIEKVPEPAPQVVAVVSPPPLPPSRKPSLEETQAAAEEQATLAKEATPVPVPVVVAVVEEKTVEPAAEDSRHSAEKTSTEIERSASSSSVGDELFDVPPPPSMGVQKLESRRSVRFGVGEEVRVEEYDYDDLLPTEEDPPTPVSGDEAMRTRRRSSLSQKVVSILKRASRGPTKKGEEDARKNGISWG